MATRRGPHDDAARRRPRRRASPAAGARPTHSTFPVVGLGASAGGLEAVRKFFDALPPDSGMAFILIQHLDPTHQSMMVDLLAGHTRMTVEQAVDGMPLERDHLYIIPPGSYLSIRSGALRLSQPRERHGARMPFDFFLRSLAEEAGARAICVILSGTGADGSLGLKAVKEKGGLVIAQKPDEAGFDGMPRSAIATDAVDLVLPVAKIPKILAKYGRQMYLKSERDAPSRSAEDGLLEIIDLLRTRTSHDFTLYKPGTLERRIARRMAMAAVTHVGRYLKLLQKDAREVKLLAKDLLINVTNFFRDPEVFELLAREIVPELVRKHGADRPLRIWVAGCSTGEETYSIAMLFLEGIAVAGRNIKLQVFASDVDEEAVAFARNGIYPETIEADVSPPRLARFFTKEDHSYRVVAKLREAAVFTVQDVLADPPFSRIDLVCCRNLLIYLRPEAQEKVLLLFHFALREDGILFLGGSETVGRLKDRFQPISRAQRIYRHVGRVRPGEIYFPVGAGARAFGPSGAQKRVPHALHLGDVAQRLLLETYAPASVLINRRNECLYYLGSTDRYLRVVSGEPSHDLLGMAREGLRNKLRAAIHRAGEEGARAIVAGAQVQYDGNTVTVSVAVQPVQSDGEDLLLVSFIEEPKHSENPGRPVRQAEDATRVAELERELDATRNELQDTIRDLEAANEEQKTINEEALSVNEEFQSTNEELVTSKEELQSLNEELTALNSQLQETLEQQRSTSNDLQNILYSSDVATLFLDCNFNIRFFTPAAKSLFRLIATDIGRPLSDLTPLAADTALLVDARTVLANLAPLRQEIEVEDGTWYNRRILPYRTHDDRIEGVVITFADISEVKAAERRIEAARTYSDSIINTVRQPLVVLDGALRIVSGNDAFYRTLALAPEQAVGRHFPAISDRLAEVADLRAFLDRVKVEPIPPEDCEVEAELPLLGRRVLLLSARTIQDGIAEQAKVLLAIDDITERRLATEALQAAKRQAEQANLSKSRFLAAASHDLRQPLQTLNLLQGLLAKKVGDPDAAKLVTRLDETLSAMSGMLDTLLDINQLEAGIVRPMLATFSVKDFLERLSTEFAYHAVARSLGWRVIPCGLCVRSDPRLLEQMVRNLLSNAVKYTEHGRVLLGCRRRGDRLRIEVWDTGPGIPEGQLQAIFEEFHQLDNAARERNRGLGLGLAIVQRLADLLGHAVDVRSRLGKGSVFAIEVPLGRREAVQPQALDHDEAAESAGRSGMILVVEDDPDVREMLGCLLTEEGYDTATAADGRSALELAASGAPSPDLVIADYNLPNGLNGLQFIARLRELLHQEIPLIILTGDISTDTLREIARHGCAQLNKPVKLKELTGLVRRLLSERKPMAAPRPTMPATKAGKARQGPVIFVVDDDQAVRQSMHDFLSQDGWAVELYANGEAFLEAYRPGIEGCLLVDAVMPGMDGFALLRRLEAESHRLPAIMITGNGDVPMAVRAMQAGAVDFIEKPASVGELLASIDHALEQMRDAAKQAEWREAAAARLAGLTARQRQILDLVLAGKPSKNIAVDLGISQRTVENHRSAIMHKTGSKSLPALVRLTLAAVGEPPSDPKALP